MQVLEHAIRETAAAWEDEWTGHGETRPIIGAVDETFLERMLLVFMDLASGYLLVEEVADDRSYDTWYDVVKARLEPLGVGVSDRAKVLIKLAETGLECLSIPDLFHLMHALAKSASLAIVSRLRQAQQALTQAQASCAKYQAFHLGGPAGQHAQALVEARAGEVQPWQGVRKRLSAPPRQPGAQHVSLASGGLEAPDVARSRTPVTSRGHSACNVVRNPCVAGQAERLGQGSGVSA
jgi:hypothetical protein